MSKHKKKKQIKGVPDMPNPPAPPPIVKVADCCGICIHWRMRENANSPNNMPGDCHYYPTTVEKYYDGKCSKCKTVDIQS